MYTRIYVSQVRAVDVETLFASVVTSRLAGARREDERARPIPALHVRAAIRASGAVRRVVSR